MRLVQSSILHWYSDDLVHRPCSAMALLFLLCHEMPRSVHFIQSLLKCSEGMWSRSSIAAIGSYLLLALQSLTRSCFSRNSLQTTNILSCTSLAVVSISLLILFLVQGASFIYAPLPAHVSATELPCNCSSVIFPFIMSSTVQCALTLYGMTIQL